MIYHGYEDKAREIMAEIGGLDLDSCLEADVAEWDMRNLYPESVKVG